MYGLLLMGHSIWRWIVLLLIVITVVKALIGWLSKQKWSNLDARLLVFSRIAVYIQVVLGVILYTVSPMYGNVQFTGGHVIVALLSVGGLEFGAARAKKVADGVNKFKFALIGFAIALVLVLLAIGEATWWKLA